MVFERKSEPEFRKGPIQKKTKKPGPQWRPRGAQKVSKGAQKGPWGSFSGAQRGLQRGPGGAQEVSRGLQMVP